MQTIIIQTYNSHSGKLRYNYNIMLEMLIKEEKIDGKTFRIRTRSLFLYRVKINIGR